MAEKDVTVKVILDPPGNNPPFHFESNDLPIGNDNVIYFSNCGKLKGFTIHYDLDDTANPGFRFPTRTTHGNDYLDEALWATQSGGCPTQQCKWDVFEARREENSGRTLVVRNKNEVAENFAYTLRVANGTNWLNLDPGGVNQNGGSPIIEPNALLIGGTALVVGAVVGTYVIAPALS